MASDTLTKKIQTQLKKKLEEQLDQNGELQKLAQSITDSVSDRLNGKLGEKLSTTAMTAAATAQMAAQTVAQSAKEGLDQVLLGLEHRGINLKDSQEKAQDFAQKVGRKVLERAEEIRAQIAENPLSPAWLKDVSLTPTHPPHFADAEAEAAHALRDVTPSDDDASVTADAAGSLTETTVSEPAEEMQPKAMKTILEEESLGADPQASLDFDAAESDLETEEASVEKSAKPASKKKGAKKTTARSRN